MHFLKLFFWSCCIVVACSKPKQLLQKQDLIFKCQSKFDTLLNKEVFFMVDEQPIYVGGKGEMLSFILSNYNIDLNLDFQGTIKVVLVIDTDGRIIRTRIVDKKDKEYTIAEKEMVRVFGLMPKWLPGKCNTETVPVEIRLPLRF